MSVTALEIHSRAPILGGRAFGETGAYEKVAGVLHFAFDPAAAVNQAVTDLSLAPRDGAGRVGASADVFLLQPRTRAGTRATPLRARPGTS